MAVSETPTHLPLATWAKILGVNPLHFEGVQIEQIQNSAICDRAWFRHPWQASDRVGREEIAQAIAQAEEDIEHQLGYRLLPSWELDEFQPTVRPYHKEFVNLNVRDVRGFGQTVETRWKWLIAGGIRSQELIEANAVIAWSTTFPPASYEDTGTVTLTLSEDCPECEIQIYYPGKDGDEAWRIRPINVEVDPVNFNTVITFRRELAVIEDIIESMSLSGDGSDERVADGTDDADFLSVVDVYREYNDPQQQITMLWEPRGDCGCGSSTCTACAYTTQAGCLLGRGDLRLGQAVYSPATWNATDLDFDRAAFAVGREPDLVRLWYYSGLRDKRVDCEIQTMSADWARTVTYLSASRLDRPPCDCVADGIWDRWAADLAFAGGATELATHALSPGDLANPMGTRRGEIYAWQRIKRPGAAIGRSAVAP